MISGSIQDQIAASGTAQVIVVIKSSVQHQAPAAAGAKLAVAIPVAASRIGISISQRSLAQIAAQFRFGESSQATALATSADGQKSAGAKWYQRAAIANNQTPQARIFPNLGVVYGSVDRTGLHSLSQDQDVQDILLAPKLSLIRPVRSQAVAPAAAAANQTTWGIKRIKADQLHQQGIMGSGVTIGHLDTGADGKHPSLKTAFHAFAEFDSFGF